MLGFGLSACGREDDPDAVFRLAQSAYERREFREAEIRLRNVILQSPLHAEAQYLLGLTYLRLNDTNAALAELGKARQLGIALDRVLPEIVTAHIRAGDANALVALTPPESGTRPETTAIAHAARGTGFASLERREEARAAFDAALALDPASVLALLGHAGLWFSEGESERALETIDRAIALTPQSHDAWRAKGEVLRAMRRNAEAAAAFEQAVRIAPDSVAARLGAALAHGLAGDPGPARTHLDHVLKRMPEHPVANYVLAMLRISQGDASGAEEAVTLSLKRLPGFPPSAVLAGILALRSGAYVQAESNFAAAVKGQPDDPYPRILHARALLLSKRGKDAIETLRPALARFPDHPQLNALTADAFLSLGQHARATDHYQKAAAAEPKTAAFRRGAGIARLGLGDAGGMSDLEAATSLDPGESRSEILLVLARIRSRDFDAAVKTADTMAERRPKEPIGHFLAGVARIAKRDPIAARANFERALAIEPAYFPAARELAALDVAAGHPAEARRRFEALLAADKTSAPAMVAMAGLEFAARRSAAAVEWLEKARAADAAAVEPRILLARHYLASEQLEKALGAAAEAEKLQPGNPEAIDAFGSVQLASGDVGGATTTFGRLVAAAPRTATALLRLGSAQLAAQRWPHAEASFAKALTLEPGSREGKAGLALARARAGRVDEAVKIAQELQSADPRSPDGWLLEGRVHATMNRHADAARAFELAYQRSKATATVLALFETLVLAQRPQDGERILTDWLAHNERDVRARLRLANGQLVSGRLAEAAEHYRRVLALAPDNTQALNNLAIAYQRLRDSRSVETGRRAHELNPADPNLADTYGWILVEAGKVKEGLALLELATTKAPKAVEIRVHYALALAKSGDKSTARGILRQLVTDGNKLDIDPEHARWVQ